MQTIARMAQRLVDATAVKGLQALSKSPADLLGAHTLLARQRFVVLVDVVVLQALKRRHRVVQASGGHAPGTNRRAHQVHGLRALRQPVPKNEAVQRPEDQTLGATGCARNDADVLRAQAVFADMGQGFGACVDMEGLHGVECRGSESCQGRVHVPRR